MTGQIIARRADLDWLRVLAFGLLIYFHTAVAFLPDSLPLIRNAESSRVLMIFVSFLQEFRLGLLFLISGVGVCFALKHRDGPAFFLERTHRLVLPMIFGLLTLVPPMVFLEKKFLGSFQGSFFEFYPQFFTQGIYPRGNLSWHHYWFIAYLYLFCCLGWPVFRQFNRPTIAERLQDWSLWMSQSGRIFLPILLLLTLEIPLRALFPGFRDLIHDWASFAQWFVLFIAGYLFAKNPVLLDRAQSIRHPALLIALVATGVLFYQFWQPGSSFTPVKDGQVSIIDYLWFCLVRMINLWCWLLVCLGFAGCYLKRSGVVLRYLNDAVYPLFCVHLTLVVALDYLIIPLDWSIATKYWTITSGTLGLSLASYELIKRSAWLRPVFGLKPLG